jgi:CIC family chloride channel protein
MKLREDVKVLLLLVRTSETAFLLFFSVLAGLGAGLGAIVFRDLITGFHAIFFDSGADLLDFLGPYHVILLPAAGGLLIGPVIHFLSKETRGTGIPEVIYAAMSLGGRIRPRIVAVKALVSSICIGSGGSAGREGPIVQIGSALASALGQSFKLSEEKTRVLVACGAAGGIAATFNAPLAGIFFSLEVILDDYNPRYFPSVVLASVAATVVSRHFLGDVPAFFTPTYQLLSPWELPFYFLFGFLAAFASLGFIVMFYRTEDLFQSLRIPEYVKPALGGLLVGLIGIRFPQVFGVGYGEIELVLHERMTAGLAIALVFAKAAATSLTLGSGGSGGVFAPSLFLGAMLGHAYGAFTSFLWPAAAIAPGAAALVGMGAVFAGVAHAPVSAILFLFEMTGDYEIIIPLMLACITSTVVVRRLHEESIYHLKLIRRGHPLPEAREPDPMGVVPVSDAMLEQVTTLEEDIPVAQAAISVRSAVHGGYPVVDRKGRLTGIVTAREIGAALAEEKGGLPIWEIMTKEVVTCYPDESLRDALKRMGQKGIGQVPVVERDDPLRLKGLVTRENVVVAYNRALHAREKDRFKGIE